MTYPVTLSENVKALALALGFDLVGICKAEATPESRQLRPWLERGYAGAMDYLHRGAELREDPSKLFPGAASMLVVGLVYDQPEDSPRDRDPSTGSIARYAVGDDYHEVLGDRLRAVAAGLEAMVDGPVRSRSYVDTGPVLERVAAAHAGLGWIGKNTCLIDSDLGSYLFLGVLVTDLDLEPDCEVEDLCGSCTACLDACPTGALEAPRLLTATRCIAFTTIENPGPIEPSLRVDLGDWIYGCDICQEVCPWNARKARQWPEDPLGLRSRLQHRPQWVRPSLAWVLDLDVSAWQRATRSSAMRRSKQRGLIRNALVAAGNSGDPSLRDSVAKWLHTEDPMLAEHARWARTKLDTCSTV